MKRWLLLLLALVCTDALAVTVRGRVNIALPYGVIPMNGANVELCPTSGPCVSYVTGPDGMYYFNVGPGMYRILVNKVERVQQVSVSNQQYVDIAPIRAN